MKIFVCEFITGGGLYREELTNRLVNEGLMMRDALLGELAQIDDVEVSCCYDYRLPAPEAEHAIVVSEDDDAWHLWQEQIMASDATWLIAPETSGTLLRLTELVAAQGKLLLGCPASVVRITSSKLNTYQVLSKAGVAAVTTYAANDWLSMLPLDGEGLGWVIKPDDGVSCEDTVFLTSSKDAVAWLEQRRKLTHVVQPLNPGEPASLSMLCRDGEAWLLSCNRQKIANRAGHFIYEGSMVNGFSKYWTLFDQVAKQVARALPDMSGYVGVDLMISDQGQIEVLEINPRLTTSYVGLRRATETNIAGLVLSLLGPEAQNTPFLFPEISRKNVEITV